MRILALLGVITTLVAAPAVAAPPVLSHRVTDTAGILSADTVSSLAVKLEALEKDTTAQVYVLTVPSLEGQDIETFSIDTFRANGIGQKGKDNGVLLLIAPKERKVRIEVGGRLEGTLTDADSKMIIVKDMKPFLHKGGTDDWDTAVSNAVGKISLAVRKDFAENTSVAPATTSNSGGGGGGVAIFFAFLGVLVIVGFVLMVRRAQRLAREQEEERQREILREQEREESRRHTPFAADSGPYENPRPRHVAPARRSSAPAVLVGATAGAVASDVGRRARQQREADEDEERRSRERDRLRQEEEDDEARRRRASDDSPSFGNGSVFGNDSPDSNDSSGGGGDAFGGGASDDV